jgi:ribosomal protein S18 acetylase RimI-like enzyme
MPTYIERFDEKDIPSLVELYKNYREEIGQDDHVGLRTRWHDFLVRLASEQKSSSHIQFYVAEDRETHDIVGFICAYQAQDPISGTHHMVIEHLYVAPEYRRQQVGTDLYATVTDAFKKHASIWHLPTAPTRVCVPQASQTGIAFFTYYANTQVSVTLPE